MCILAVVGKCLENSCPAFILLIFSKAAESSFAVFLTHHFIIDGTVNQIAELIPNKYLILTLFTICYAIVLYILGYLWKKIVD